MLSEVSSPRLRRSFVLRTLFVLILWFLSSSVAVVLTKSLFVGSHLSLPPFPLGLTVTATNNIVAGTTATLFNGPPASIYQDVNIKRLALIIGATTAAEIGLSNIALNLLSVSYATVLKGMAPFFVMAWGAAMGLQRIRLNLMLTMLTIAVGLALAVVGEGETIKASLSQFLRAGFVAQLLSALLSGFRWILTQVFIKGQAINNDRLSSILKVRPLTRGLSAMGTIRMTAPYTLLWVLPFVAVGEGTALVQWIMKASLIDVVKILTVLVVIGICVYGLLWAEYELVRVTSSLTVSVGFVMKEVLMIFAGLLVFHDRMSTLTFVGFIVVQGGIFAYSFVRMEPVEEEQQKLLRL